MTELSERDKKFLLAGGICVIIYLGYMFVVEPVFSRQINIEKQIQKKILFIEKYYEILNRSAFYKQKKKGTEILQNQLAKQFFPLKKPSLAAAGLQKILKNHARKTSVTVITTRTEKPKYVEGLLAFPVEITVRSTLKNLSRFLFLVENNNPLLVVENLSIKRVGKNDTPEELKSRILVLGFLQQLEPEPSRKT